MRHLAVGDLHGCFTALTTLAAFVPFRPDDVIITLGDYVNRGPQTAAVLDWLIARDKTSTLIPLRGNHEIMMLLAREDHDAFERWLDVGGDRTLASYSRPSGTTGDPGRLIDIPDEHWDFLTNRLRPWHEIETHFFVHANAYADAPLAEQPDFMLYWERFDAPPPHENGKIMVCGHTSQRSGRPRNLGHAVCIDTKAYGGGWLTCLDIATGQYWQANERGETRTDWLE
jgi:serine/threonine protein phosphatase 1